MRTLILSHKADIDGLSPVIFLKLIRERLDVVLLNAGDACTKIAEIIKNNSYKKYDEIYITDLTLDKRTCELIMSTGDSEKFHTFDHHAFDLCANNYPFGVAISKNTDGVNECATSLFYKYLCSRYPKVFDNNAMKEYTELVRLNDTWDWAITNNIDAKNLSELQSILGRDNYIETYVNFLKVNTEHFYYTSDQKYLLKVEQDRINRYLEETEKTMFYANLLGKRCGIVFAESHRSILGNYLTEKYSHLIDYVIIINMQQGISFRSRTDEMDVSQVAKIYGGGGHVKASGAPMDNKLKKEVIKLILNNKNLFN